MDTPTLLNLAQSAVDVGNIKAACEFYEIALLQSPNNEDILEAYAEIMIHHVQDIERAKQMLRHAIEINPNVGYVKYLNLAQLTEAEEALRLYQSAHDIAHLELGSCRKKKAKQALMETLATICCAMVELYLTDLCFHAEAEVSCEEWVQKALGYNPNGVEAHQLHASLLLSQNNTAAALEALRRAVDLTHRLSEAHQPTYESKVELGRLLMQASPDEAFGFLLEILQLGDNNPYVWFLLGECARMRGRYIDAARLLRRARMMLVISDGDTNAIAEVDHAIRVLVEEMGGAEEAAKVPDLDHHDPISLLQPENDEENEDEKENELDDPAWESCAENED
ncbi:unnamed protein product [Phytomonas sp. Hart1]|nr:unnamed protein product [Phytomonas sp. Hart1]|eukprot:CCW68919.1 unnamed protein product [Phytomonas sp. isolate Hart1]